MGVFEEEDEEAGEAGSGFCGSWGEAAVVDFRLFPMFN